MVDKKYPDFEKERKFEAVPHKKIRLLPFLLSFICTGGGGGFSVAH
jgi:hypothetical protein